MNDRIRVQRKKGFNSESDVAKYSNFNSEESGLHIPLEVNEIDQSQISDPEMKDSDEMLKNKIVNHGPGQELEPGVQQQLNSRFGHSFAQLRVHTDSEGDQLTRSVDAT